MHAFCYCTCLFAAILGLFAFSASAQSAAVRPATHVSHRLSPTEPAPASRDTAPAKTAAAAPAVENPEIWGPAELSEQLHDRYDPTKNTPRTEGMTPKTARTVSVPVFAPLENAAPPPPAAAVAAADEFKFSARPTADGAVEMTWEKPLEADGGPVVGQFLVLRRSKNTQKWETIGGLVALPGDINAEPYRFLDRQTPAAGPMQYMLKAIESGGKERPGAVVEVKIERTTEMPDSGSEK